MVAKIYTFLLKLVYQAETVSYFFIFCSCDVSWQQRRTFDQYWKYFLRTIPKYWLTKPPVYGAYNSTSRIATSSSSFAASFALTFIS